MERLKFADIAKAIAIVCMLFGHTGGTSQLALNFIYSFHMPLFFILAGYFLKETLDVKASVKKDFISLIVPYIVTSAIIAILAAINEIYIGGNGFEALKKWILAALYGSGSLVAPWAGSVVRIGALWFLLALFLSKLIFYITARLGKYQWIAIVLFSYIGYATTSYTWLPLSIQAGMCTTLYVYLGHLISKYDLFNKSITPPARPYIPVAFLVWIFCIINGCTVSTVNNEYGDGFLSYIGSICGTFCIIWISMLIEKFGGYAASALAKIGQATLPILCMHMVEQNVFPWAGIYEKIHYSYSIRILLRFAVIFIMCIIISYIPILNQIFFPKKRTKKSIT